MQLSEEMEFTDTCVSPGSSKVKKKNQAYSSTLVEILFFLILILVVQSDHIFAHATIAKLHDGTKPLPEPILTGLITETL